MGISHTMGMTRVPSDLFHRGPQKLLLLKTPMVSTTTIDPYRADNFFAPQIQFADAICLSPSLLSLPPTLPEQGSAHTSSLCLCVFMTARQ